MTRADQAVNLAAAILRDGKTLTHAVNAAAKTYGVDHATIRSGLSQRSGRSQKGRARPASRLKPLTPEEGAAMAKEIEELLTDRNAAFTPEDRKRLERIHVALTGRLAISPRQANVLKHLRAVAAYGYGYDL